MVACKEGYFHSQWHTPLPTTAHRDKPFRMFSSIACPSLQSGGLVINLMLHCRGAPVALGVDYETEASIREEVGSLGQRKL